MIRRTPRSTRTDTLVPYTTLFRSPGLATLVTSPEDRSSSLRWPARQSGVSDPPAPQSHPSSHKLPNPHSSAPPLPCIAEPAPPLRPHDSFVRTCGRSLSPPST